MTPRRRSARRAPATLVGIALLTACGLSTPSGPVDDETLFAQIQGLDGVTSADLSFVSDMTRGDGYDGTIVLDESLTEDEAACVSRQVYEIFWQGRRASDSSVLVIHGDTRGTMVAASGLEDLYGPRPTEPRASATISPCSETDPG